MTSTGVRHDKNTRVGYFRCQICPRSFLMVALRSRCGHYILPCGFFYLLSFFLAYSQPSRIGCLSYYHTWCGLTATHVNGYWYFGRNVIGKVSNQKTLYYATSNNLRFCITWQKGKHENYIFTRCISAFPEFNQSLLDFFNLFDSRLILTPLY